MVKHMSDDDPLKSLLDGDISSEELDAIRSSPDLRKLAIRMYGESILNLLGEDIADEISENELVSDDELEMVDIIPEPIQVVRSTVDIPVRSKKSQKEGRSIGGMMRNLVGILGIGAGLTNVYWGLGNVLSTCSTNVHSTCGVSLKLNLLEFHRMQEHIAWGPTGQWGIPDFALVGVSALIIIIGMIRKQ
jgi:hypothetical protein